ncbi:MAG: DUF86 domain-containing protein [Candidatus Woesearchaeota archaeon]
MGRIDDKIKEIEDFLQQLEPILPFNFMEYKNDFEKKAACERYFEKIVEAIVDLAFLVVKEKKLTLPEDEKVVFEILGEEKIISKNLVCHLKEAKGMRNILAHQYGTTDDKQVFNSITNELIRDTQEFLECIKKTF